MEKIKIGQTWYNVETGYRLKILDIGKIEIWAEWENKNKGSFNIVKFLEIYKLVNNSNIN